MQRHIRNGQNTKKTKKKTKKKREGENRSTNLLFSTQQTNRVRIVKLAAGF
jgi:hypothetical protein